MRPVYRSAYASLRAASGDDPVYVAEQLGHTDPRFTLTVYTKAVKRRAKLSVEYLAESERALAWAALATSERAEPGRILRRGGARAPRASLGSGLSTHIRRLGGVVTQRPAKP